MTFDYLRVNELWGKAKNALGEAHDLIQFYPAKASVKLAEVVGLVNEMDSLCVQLADEQSERMEEPYDSGWTVDFNRSAR